MALVASVVSVVVLVMLTDRFTTGAEGVNDWLAGLPSAVQTVGSWMYVVGTVGATVVVIGAVAMTGHLRLAFTVGITGAVSLLVAATLADGSVIWLAAATAVLLTVVPYLVRPARRLVRWVELVAVVGAVLAPITPVAAVAAAVGVGWAVSAATNLAIGTPSATPTTSSVIAALGAFGIAIGELTLADGQRWGETRFLGRTSSHAPASVVVIGRDAADARLLNKLWRSLMYRDAGPAISASRSAQLEHRAYMVLMAAKSGVPVSDVVLTASGGHDDLAVLVVLDPVGRPLSELAATEITDAVLDDVWTSLTRLHGAGLAHGLIGPDNILVTEDATTAFVDFCRGSSAAPAERCRLDCVDLLASSAALVGDERAVASAQRALGNRGLTELLPLLQTAALSAAARRAVTDPRKRLKQLREAAAAATGDAVPDLIELRRISVASAAMAAATFVGFYLIVAQFAGVDLASTLADAQWSWVVVVAVLSVVPQFSGAVALMGAVSQPMPYGPVLAEQFANNFTGLIGGTPATTALVIRFFQKQGMKAAVAISSGVLNSLAWGAVEIVLVVVGLLVSDATFVPSDAGGGGLGKLILLTIVIVGVGVTLALLVPKLRSAIRRVAVPQIAAARENLQGILSTPRKALMLFGGTLCSQLVFAMVIGVALRAYGYSLPLADLVVINCFASLVGGMTPVPGGLGVVEAGLIAGMTSFGIPNSVAVAATFTARLFTTYLPPIWGWIALQWLRHHDYV